MKFERKIGSDGEVETVIDFEGARLPNGIIIDEVLEENNTLKREVNRLKTEIENSSSILVRIIPNKTIRIIVETGLIVGTLIGIIQLI
ncbi:MAG: hypothetical protein WC410_00480 [Candidatus Paceibacterota bacterium]|jgi:hypothetical protein